MSDEKNEHMPNFVISRQEASGVMGLSFGFYPKEAEELHKFWEVSMDKYIEYRSALIDARRFYNKGGEHDGKEYADAQEKWRKELSDSGIALHTKEVAGVKWTYAVKDGAASIGDGFGVAIPPSTSGEITIPSILDGCPVTSIECGAFSGCQELTGVKIPDSVTSIGGCSFSSCIRLKSVTMPNGVTYLGREAFSHCTALADVFIPDSLTEVWSSVFEECRALPEMKIAEMEKRHVQTVERLKEALEKNVGKEEKRISKDCEIADKASDEPPSFETPIIIKIIIGVMSILFVYGIIYIVLAFLAMESRVQ